MHFYKITCTLFNFFFRIMYKMDVEGLENIPLKGRVIICSNHVSLLDPLVLAAVSPRKLNYMAKKELFEKKILGFLIKNLGAFPVDRDKGGLSAIKKAIKILSRDDAFAMFPQGTRVHNVNDNSSKPGIAMIAIKSKSPIIPIYVDTEYKLFKKLKLTIGKPISFNEYYDQKMDTDQYKSLSELILKEIYDLK